MNGVSPEKTNEIFYLRKSNSYYPRHPSLFIVPLVDSLYNGTQSATYSGPKIWEIIPSEIQNIDLFDGFTYNTFKASSKIGFTQVRWFVYSCNKNFIFA